MTTSPPVPPDDSSPSVSSSAPPKPWVDWLQRHWVIVVGGFGLLVTGVAVGAIGARLFVAKSVEQSATPVSGKPPGQIDDTVTFSPDQQKTSGIAIAMVSPKPLVSHLWRTGHVTLNEDYVAHICPPVEGVIREVTVNLGQTVAPGESLAILDSREFGQAKLDAYRAKIALAAERELAARTQTTMTNAEALLKLLAEEKPLIEIEKQMADKPIGDWRQQLLGAYSRRNQLRNLLASQQSSMGAISAANIRKTESESEAAGATYTALIEEMRFQVKNQVRQAELKLKDAETASDVARAKLLLFGLSVQAIDQLDPIAEGASASHLVIKAPFAGTVVKKHAVRLERVGPQSQMFVLTDLSKLWVQADIFESDLPSLRGRSDQTIVFQSLVANIHDRKGKIVYSGDIIDTASRSLTLTAETSNTDRLLKPGMFVDVRFDISDSSECLQVPKSAILWHENQPFVFVQEEDDTFRRTLVTLGRSAGEEVEVTAGIRAGDRVVVRGGFVLKSELLKDQMMGE